MKILEALNISKAYDIGTKSVPVLSDIRFSVADGEFVVIMGSSGSGKTTLLSLLSGLDRPTSGRIFIEGKEITDCSEDDLARLRNATVGIVFQAFHLVPSLTAFENVAFPAELKGDPEGPRKTEALLERVGLIHRRDSFPHQLSGGEKQRTAICRALINRPRILFADEPTGNLDSANGRAILDLLLEFHRELRTTLVMVTHNGDIARMADRVVVLSDGRIASEDGHVP